MDDETSADQDYPLRVQLDLDLDRQPISGRLRTRWGADNRFEGWLGFVNALRRLQELRKES